MINLTKKLERSDALERFFLLKKSKTNTGSQYRITLPKDFVKLNGWRDGDTLRIAALLGSGALFIEKKKKE